MGSSKKNLNLKCISLQIVLFSTLLINEGTGLEPLFTSVAVGAGIASSAIYAGYDTLKCRWENDCCSPPSIKHNVTEFEELFDRYVYGQHLARDLIAKALRSHVRKLDPNQPNNPKKALVLSFHGWTGGGKNYVAKFISDALFAKGIKSRNVHLFVSTLHFPISDKADLYKVMSKIKWIKN